MYEEAPVTEVAPGLREGCACAASHICSHVARVEQQHRRAAVGPKVTVQRFCDDVDRRLGCTGEGSGGDCREIGGRSMGDSGSTCTVRVRAARPIVIDGADLHEVSRESVKS